MFAVCSQNYRERFSPQEAAATQHLWYQVFGNRDDGLMETACRLVLLNCKRFPTIADFNSAIDELLHTEPPQHPALPAPRDRAMSPAARKVLKLVRQGQAREYLDEVDVTDLMAFAREKWPDITESLVRRNLCEIMRAKEVDEMCQACMWAPKDCVSGGYRSVYSITPEGWLEETMMPCQKVVRGVEI